MEGIHSNKQNFRLLCYRVLTIQICRTLENEDVVKVIVFVSNIQIGLLFFKSIYKWCIMTQDYSDKIQFPNPYLTLISFDDFFKTGENMNLKVKVCTVDFLKCHLDFSKPTNLEMPHLHSLN